MRKTTFADTVLDNHGKNNPVPSYFNATLRQYLRPDGRRTTACVNLPRTVEAAYLNMLQSGKWLACEVLRTFEVSITIEDDDQDYDIEVTENGEKVVDAVVAVLERRAWEK